MPPKVEYLLTDWWQALCPALDAMLRWAEQREALLTRDDSDERVMDYTGLINGPFCDRVVIAASPSGGMSAYKRSRLLQLLPSPSRCGHARQHLLETLLDAIDRGAWQANDADCAQLEQVLAESIARHGSDCVLPSCQATKLVKMEQPAPAAEPSPTAANIEGYALEPRAATPVQPVQQEVWLWLLVTTVFVAVGWVRRPR